MNKQIKTVAGLKKLGTIMTVWAHPDDESYSCAGIMAAAVQNGQTVVCVTATKGELGVQDETRWPQAQLGEIRAKEMNEAMKTLGVRHHHWLGYQDGSCKEVPVPEAVAKLRELIQQYQPDTILTFGPEGMTGHDDHCTVSKWVSVATKDTKIMVYHAVQLKDLYERSREADADFNIFFNIDQPPIFNRQDCDLILNLNKKLLDAKYRCLCAMPSQTEAMFKQFGQKFICNMIAGEAFVRAKL